MLFVIIAITVAFHLELSTRREQGKAETAAVLRSFTERQEVVDAFNGKAADLGVKLELEISGGLSTNALTFLLTAASRSDLPTASTILSEIWNSTDKGRPFRVIVLFDSGRSIGQQPGGKGPPGAIDDVKIMDFIASWLIDSDGVTER